MGVITLDWLDFLLFVPAVILVSQLVRRVLESGPTMAYKDGQTNVIYVSRIRVVIVGISIYDMEK